MHAIFKTNRSYSNLLIYFNTRLFNALKGHLQMDNNIMSKIILIICFYLIGKKDIYKKLILVKLQ